MFQNLSWLPNTPDQSPSCFSGPLPGPLCSQAPFLCFCHSPNMNQPWLTLFPPPVHLHLTKSHNHRKASPTSRDVLSLLLAPHTLLSTALPLLSMYFLREATVYISYLSPERKLGQPWIPILAQPEPSCVIGHMLLHLSTPQCPHLLDGRLPSTSEDQLG